MSRTGWPGGSEQAEQAFVEVVAKRSTSGERHVVLRAGYDLGGVQQAQGRLSAALRTYQRQVETAATRGAPSSVGMAHVGMAKVLYERDELRLAREHATIGIEQLPAALLRPTAGRRPADTRPDPARRG